MECNTKGKKKLVRPMSERSDHKMDNQALRSQASLRLQEIVWRSSRSQGARQGLRPPWLRCRFFQNATHSIQNGYRASIVCPLFHLPLRLRQIASLSHRLTNKEESVKHFPYNLTLHNRTGSIFGTGAVLLFHLWQNASYLSYRLVSRRELAFLASIHACIAV